MNIELAGQVSYRISTNQSLLDAFQMHINESLDVYFPPEFLFITTWNRVAQFGADPSVVRIDVHTCYCEQLEMGRTRLGHFFTNLMAGLEQALSEKE